MAVASVNASMPYQSASLVSNLKANGLTAEKANLAAADVQGAIQQVGMAQRGPANKAAITEALQQRISADVASGKLSTSDAAAVYKTFEQMDPAKQNGGAGGPPPSDGSAPPPSKGAGSQHGGAAGGAAQDPSTKVILSQTDLVIGNLQTMMIIYTDGTSDTKTQPVSNDAKLYTKSYAANGQAMSVDGNANSIMSGSKVQSYLSTIQAGSLFDLMLK